MGYSNHLYHQQLFYNLLSIPFMGYEEIEKAKRRGVIDFQFPLWDTIKFILSSVGTILPFNSLYGILYYEICFSRLRYELSIPFMGYLEYFLV